MFSVIVPLFAQALTLTLAESTEVRARLEELEALRSGDVSRMRATLQAHEPLVIADSVYRGDAIRAVAILRTPERFFYNVARPGAFAAILTVGRELYRSGDDDALRFAVFEGHTAAPNRAGGY